MPSVLTMAAVERLKPDPAKRVEVPDGGLPSFYLVIQPSGAKSWAVRYRHGGKSRKHTIGPYPALDLKRARDMAREALSRVAIGADPGVERTALRRAADDVTRSDRDLVRNITGTFIDRYAKTNTREASWRMTKRLLDADVTREWGDRRVQDITRRDVVELLDKIVDRGAPILANRTLAATRRMFGWLRERGVVEINPAEGVKAPAPEQSRDRVLSDKELRLVWKAAEGIGQPFGPMVQLLILTGQRLREVGEMSDREVDLASRMWTIPRARAKNDVAHTVPLSEGALAVLASVHRVKGERAFVFSTTGTTAASGYSRAKERLDAEMLRLARLEAERAGNDTDAIEIPNWTYHDLRRTMASGMARLGINLPPIEKVLNHISGSFRGVVSIYQRHSFADEKKHALDTWARFVASLVEEKPSNVVQMAGRA